MMCSEKLGERNACIRGYSCVLEDWHVTLQLFVYLFATIHIYTRIGQIDICSLWYINYAGTHHRP